MDWRTPKARLGSSILLALLFLVGCAETTEPGSAKERFEPGTKTRVEAPIPYREGSPDIQGETPIRKLLDLKDPSGDTAPVWFGFGGGDAYPSGTKREFGKACDANFGNKVYELDALPAVIEGVVTLHPQHYEKVGICGEDHRFYGTYFLQDDTGTILVLKDSRIADFTYGDRVRLRVRGVVKQFGTLAVTAFDQEEIVADASDESLKVPFERLDESYKSHFERDGMEWQLRNCFDLTDGFAVPQGFANNYRITGRVCREPNSRNFNELLLQNRKGKCVDNPKYEWTVSLGLELGRRGLEIERGDVITVTGPVSGRLVGLVPACEWTFRMLATTFGQFDGVQ